MTREADLVADASAVEALFDEHWVTCGITWSPSGKRLLLAVYRRGRISAKTRQPIPQLYTVDPNGQHWQRLRLGLPLASCGASWR